MQWESDDNCPNKDLVINRSFPYHDITKNKLLSSEEIETGDNHFKRLDIVLDLIHYKYILSYK